MRPHASGLNANAVIGMRCDASKLSPGVTEALAYETEVVVKRA